MIIRQFILTKEAGLHARPALLLVDLASKFCSTIYLEKEDTRYNAKSIVSVLSAGIAQGEKFNLIIEGADEHLADQVLHAFFKK
ncbi:MAG TPA: HPr family phosphocarrier protein [Peptococcaceae bacterium]|jgi:phosphocarrier protein HPr|nr:HPr family phosphocarrier protein [Clostridia bacterium]HOB81401.1 HPr family phosphocarrier protein [Peptococcaceae bacterium]HPZ71620.1 HPr family phosphocarrier protein [Peptococcaceae bacterium]HQD53452.1 HPr family phosphocarrier protein [Peptococcaceae bacterium]